MLEKQSPAIRETAAVLKRAGHREAADMAFMAKSATPIKTQVRFSLDAPWSVGIDVFIDTLTASSVSARLPGILVSQLQEARGRMMDLMTVSDKAEIGGAPRLTLGWCEHPPRFFRVVIEYAHKLEHPTLVVWMPTIERCLIDGLSAPTGGSHG